MTTWDALVDFIRGEYKIIEEEGDEIRLLVEYADERSQMIHVCREILDKREEWVQIASVCGRVEAVDLRRLLEELGQTSIVCGLVIMGEHVVLRHALPLENLDINEFIDPLTFVADTADQLEELFFGGDGY